MGKLGRIKTVDHDMNQYKKMVELNSQNRKTGLICFLIIIVITIILSAYMVMNKERSAIAIIQEKNVMYEHSSNPFFGNQKTTDKYIWKVSWQDNNILSFTNVIHVSPEIYDDYNIGDMVVITMKGNRVHHVQ